MRIPISWIPYCGYTIALELRWKMFCLENAFVFECELPLTLVPRNIY